MAVEAKIAIICKNSSGFKLGGSVQDRHTFIRPVLVVNVFLVTRPHAILEAACFGHYCHYLALRMLSSITKINVTILSVVCPGNVQIVQDMLR